MAFCKNCGAQLEEDSKFCPACGAPVEGAAETKKAAEEPNFFQKCWNVLYNGPDHSSEYDASELEANKAMGILSYISILVLIPLFAAKDVKSVRFHVNQGFTLFLCELIIGIVCGVLGVIPFIGWIFSIIGYLCYLAEILYSVIGIMHVVKGEEKELYYIGKYTFLK